jgi:predicted NAD/FAD-dependent oxidoreductase
MTPRVMEDLVEPLCVAALNTPATRASGQVFLKVLQDALLGQGFGSWRSAHLLLPRQHLGALLPEAAIRFLQSRGADIREGQRVRHLSACGDGWQVETPEGIQATDAVILACPAGEAARLLADVPAAPEAWRQQAMQLTHEPIATVYMAGTLSRPWPSPHGMVALRNGPSAPAQYAFHRTQLLGSIGQPDRAETDAVELALVASACHLERQALEAAALAQARHQLGFQTPRWVQTVVEKRATFACTPGLSRPAQWIHPHLLVAGDYVEGPYPATLEGAVRSGLQAADRLIPASA